MDVVYVCRAGDRNEELRYSLRSIARHLAHDRVWIAGYRPSWVQNVEHIPVEQTGTKWQNSTANLRAACEHPDVPDTFILMNDDFYLLADMDEVPVQNRGQVDDVAAANSHDDGAYVRGMRQTATRLREHGITDPLSFELHVPMPVDKDVMLRAIDMGRDVQVWHKRTAYGNLAGLTGDTIRDVKIHGRRGLPQVGDQFVSTNDHSSRDGEIGRYLRARFRQRCRYERS